MFKSLIKLGEDVVKTATAPIEIAADLTRTITKPIADTAEDIKDDVKEATRDPSE